MEVVHPRVAGIDVHKKILWVAVRLPGEHKPIIRKYPTFWRSLQKMAADLVEYGVTDVAMESTGVYWWPVYHALAQTGKIEVCLANAEHLKSVPGRKSDLRDCQWIAELHSFGLLRPSFIPTQQVAALRARTRYRKKLIEARMSEGQRLAKVLEDAGIKIDSVASRLLGASGRDMIEALIAGERDPHLLADLARGVLRRKHEDLMMACDGRFTPAHAAMCRLHLDAHDHATGKIAELDVLVAQAAAPFEAVISRLMTIAGIGRRTAEVIVAETGGDMSRFPTPGQLAAWTGLAPGNRESAGKRKRTGARKGNRHLKAAMVEAAWATARTRSRPGARMRRLIRRFGPAHAKKAAVAVAHTLLRVAWAVMARQEDYREDGGDFYDRRQARHAQHLAVRYQKTLERLGYHVTLIPPDPALADVSALAHPQEPPA
ncbi:IS110 family transposase [Acrocarpospora catenulata]|uniref:IS110 family transposase n=1 Tax=Acrocarpospora catenulata TaxID=2836182 RepID=UPI001BD989C5|nr:IS110 family transposase [Acrocarpospora catenulata]